jgi:hypothetical protein
MAAGFGAAVLVIGTVSTAPLAAQVQITPYFTGYYPVGKLAEATLQGVPFEAIQNQGLGFGANLGFMFTDVLGVELGGAYVFSGAFIRSCDASIAPFCLTTSPAQLKGSIMIGQLDLKFRPRGTNFFFVLGPGFALRAGDAWSHLASSDKFSFGGMVGLGVIARVAPRFALEIRAEAYGYSFNPDPTSFSSKFRPDVLLKVGVPIPSR